MSDHQSRREFIRRALAAGTAVPVALSCASDALALPQDKKAAPSERLNIGIVGPRGRGHANLRGVASENIVALCDIDAQRLDAAGKEFPKAATYKDYRKLLERKDLDAVVVSTPDHMHALPAVAAMRAGLDVYCEKPLAHSVHEVRAMRDAAKKHGRVTQMGTQIHAGKNYRRCVEIVQAGLIGPVRRVHVWMGGRPQTDGVRVEKGTPPAHVDYDLWLGPAPYRPYHPSHFHFKWRYWFDFGGGVLADFGCHFMDLPHWALGLRNATTVQATGEKTYKGANDVPDRLQVEYRYPARGKLPPVHLTWYHGGLQPQGAEAYKKSSAVLFEGDNGRLLADYHSRKLYMDDGAAEPAMPPQAIPNSVGHHREWLEAIRSRGETTCNFDYSGALAETVLLGNVSYRVGGKKLAWDDEKLVATNCPAAAQYVRREYRKGWTL